MRRPIMIPAVRLWALLAVFLFAATASAQSPLGGQGTISGKVVDQSGKPVPYASVVLVGTQWGGMSVDDGSFTIVNIPAGTYTMKALIIGYTEDQKDGITVIPNQTATVNFSVAETTLGSLNEVEITAQKEKIDIKSTDTSHEIDSKDLESLPVNEISEAIGLKAGVIAKGGELHFRGGRSGEVNIMVDGVAVKDPLLGAGAAPATLAVEATGILPDLLQRLRDERAQERPGVDAIESSSERRTGLGEVQPQPLAERVEGVFQVNFKHDLAPHPRVPGPVSPDHLHCRLQTPRNSHSHLVDREEEFLGTLPHGETGAF